MRYPTEELDELEVFLLRHDKKFCEFLSKQLGVEILDWWDISFSWEVVTCVVEIERDCNVRATVSAKDFIAWTEEVDK